MFLSRRNLCFIVIILVQMVNVRGQMVNVRGQMVNFLGQMDESKWEVAGTVPPPITRNYILQGKTNVTATNSYANVAKFNCLTDKVYGSVEIVNATRLMKLLMLEPGLSNRSRNDKDGRLIPGTCMIVLFYARWCTFCNQAAPHFNALSRSFAHIKAVAIDAIKYQNFNAQYGIGGVPTLMLVHNGKPVAMYNDTVYTLLSFAKCITLATNLQPTAPLFVTSADFVGPVSSTPSNETDYCLVLSWIFIAACALYFTSQSRWWQQCVELIQNTWRESNAQHEHAD